MSCCISNAWNLIPVTHVSITLLLHPMVWSWSGSRYVKLLSGQLLIIILKSLQLSVPGCPLTRLQMAGMQLVIYYIFSGAVLKVERGWTVLNNSTVISLFFFTYILLEKYWFISIGYNTSLRQIMVHMFWILRWTFSYICLFLKAV